MAHRVFVALWPGEATRRALSAWQNRWSWQGAARAALLDAADLHVTLHFLGAPSSDRLPALVDALRRIEIQPFSLHFGRGALWPRGLAVALPNAVPTTLLDLHGRIGTALRTLDFAVEDRPYRPHVTFARKAEGASAVDADGDEAIVWPARAFALAESVAAGDRRYRVIARFARARQPPSGAG